MPLTRIDSAFLDLDAIGGIDFDVQSGVPTLSVDATTHQVGIGTDNPTNTLEISKVENHGITLRRPAGGTNPGTVKFEVHSHGAGRLVSERDFNINFDTDNLGNQNFSVSSNGSQKLHITSAGNVGIGTNNPSSVLHVNGFTTLQNVKGGRIRQTGPGYTNLGEGSYYCAPASRSIAPNTSKTITISGLQSGWATLRGGGYSSAGQSQFSFMYHFGGYMTATHTYDVHTVREWGNGVTITTSKSASNFTITLQNNSSSYTLSVHLFLETSSPNVILASN